jgi:predicted Zn-dependent peptidase
MNLAFFALYNKAEDADLENEKIQNVTEEQLNSLAEKIIQPQKASVLYYNKTESN